MSCTYVRSVHDDPEFLLFYLVVCWSSKRTPPVLRLGGGLFGLRVRFPPRYQNLSRRGKMATASFVHTSIRSTSRATDLSSLWSSRAMRVIFQALFLVRMFFPLFFSLLFKVVFGVFLLFLGCCRIHDRIALATLSLQRYDVPGWYISIVVWWPQEEPVSRLKNQRRHGLGAGVLNVDSSRVYMIKRTACRNILGF